LIKCTLFLIGKTKAKSITNIKEIKILNSVFVYRVDVMHF